MAQHFYKFGPYRLDPVERVLQRDNQPVPLPPKDIEVLIVLVQRAGHIVDKEELFEKVWPGVFIEEGNLSRRIFNLRQALGDGVDGQKYIETIPRRGYRFVAALREDIEPAPIAAPQPAAAPVPEPKQAAPAVKRTRPVWLWASAIMIFLALSGALASRHFLDRRHASSEKVMLAVLPFTNMSGEPGNDYFADGFTEEMITQLGQVQPARLGVIARTSAMHYKSTQLTAAQICKEIGVNYLLEGSVRQAADQARITGQLIQCSDQTHLWAETYDRPMTDVLHLQQDIAARITRSLRLELLPAQASPASVAHLDPEAYRKYLLALNEWRGDEPDGIEKAIHHLHEAIAIEPDNARYYEALSQVYDASPPYNMAPQKAYPLLKQAAQKALELDPNLAIPHAMLGDAYLVYDWDWKAAEEEYRRALALNPSSSDAQVGYADLLSTLGRHDEALAHVQQVYLADPLALEYRQETLWVYFFSGRMEETVAQARKTIELEPKAGYPDALMALAYAQMGRREEAVQAADKARSVTDRPGVIAVAVSALARVGEQQKARQMLNQANILAKTKYICSFLLSAALVDLGEKEKAMASLEQAYRDRSN